ncbi:unnamed protein product [Danaus chrysippus]|uniref:(African queen) hypothetical protein n=1 Tax=Danaus chrysippus TaxID=151541 RepID=A0A8J2W0R1_9NEOP|nr:unnamed protein product [Danaus chrysippus]
MKPFLSRAIIDVCIKSMSHVHNYHDRPVIKRNESALLRPLLPQHAVLVTPHGLHHSERIHHDKLSSERNVAETESCVETRLRSHEMRGGWWRGSVAQCWRINIQVSPCASLVIKARFAA